MPMVRMPDEGSQFRVTEKSMISKMANQKEGMARPITLTKLAA